MQDRDKTGGVRHLHFVFQVHDREVPQHLADHKLAVQAADQGALSRGQQLRTLLTVDQEPAHSDFGRAGEPEADVHDAGGADLPPELLAAVLQAQGQDVQHRELFIDVQRELQVRPVPLLADARGARLRPRDG